MAKRLPALLFGTASFATGYGLAADQRPPMDEAKCKLIWSMASPKGEALPRRAAMAYVLNYSKVDIDHDDTITAQEFLAACKLGYVKDATIVKDMMMTHQP
jgi:hypothetical protein